MRWPGPSSITGEELTDGEWMVTTGDGLMISCSIGYLAKRSAFNDWLVFSEKFSVPGVLGRTSAASGSPEANAMADAVKAFGHDWSAVITGDDGSHEEPIKIIQAQGNPAAMPMPAVIERVDRRMAALYRGADLSSMSSGPSGEGSGASLQDKETDILRRDDAETIAETLEEISRMVIEWHFGNGVEPRARVELVVPVAEDASKVVEGAAKLADRGAKVSSSALMDRLNLPKAKDDSDALRPEAKTQDGMAQAVRPADAIQDEIHNAMDTWALSEWLGEFRAALSADLQPLGDALASALQESDLPAMQAALRKISERMPELAGDASELSQVLAGRMADAFLGSDTEDVENGDFKGHPFRGNQWNRSARSWKKGDRPKGRGIPDSERKVGSIREVLDSAWNNPDSNDFVEYQKIDVAESEAIAERTGEKKRLAGTARTLRADDAIHVMIHSDDDTPVTERDVEDVARHLSDPLDQVWQKRANQAERLRSIVQTSKGELVIVEEEQTKNGRLALKSMHFKGKKTPPKP